jgi:hypothetical protein
MRNLNFLFKSFLVVLILASCGKDGSNGVAFIALDWDFYVDGYNDNNSSIPGSISRNFDYSTKPGTYTCDYVCSDGSGDVWYWNYQYTIRINFGEEGKFLSNGDNGKNRHYKLFLSGLSNASLSVTEKQNSKKAKKSLPRFNLPDGKRIYIGESQVEELVQNGLIITIKKQRFIIGK